MKPRGLGAFLSIAFAALAVGTGWPAGTRAEEPATSSQPFRAETLADGVYLFRPVDERSPRANSLVVERDDGLLVVDAQPTAQAAAELLAAIGQRSVKPIRYLVLSHPHAESAGGASGFPEATVVVGTLGCHAAITDAAYDFGAEMRALAPDTESWTEPRRRPPALVVYGRVDLADARNPVELLALPEGHSPGDLLVHLPKSGLYHAGGLLFLDHNPYATQADVGGWLTSLNQLARQTPKIVVGVRGPAVGDQAVREARDALAWLRGQVETGFLDRLPLEQIAERVLATPGIEKHFDREASPSFLSILVAQVIEEAAAHRRKRAN